jgi:type III secretion system YscQ/HrcQ family protein
VLTAATVEERHARIFRVPGGQFYMLEHRSEGFGVLLNGGRIPPHEPVTLNSGDVLAIPAAPPLTVTWDTPWIPEATAELLVERSAAESWEAFREGAPPVPYRWSLDAGTPHAVILEADSDALHHLIRTQAEPGNDLADSVLIRYVASLSDSLLPPVSLRAGLQIPEPEVRGISVSAGIRLSAGGLRVRCFVPFPAVEALRARYPVPEPEQPAVVVTGTYWVAAGRQQLTAAEVAALEPGDFIRLEHGTTALIDERAPDRCWAAVPAGDAIRLLSVSPANLFPLEDSMTEPVSNGLDIDALPVQIAVIIARKELPYGEIRRLAEGEILPLERGWSGPVDIALNGKILGKGELVDVDGTLAVKLCGWSGA